MDMPPNPNAAESSLPENQAATAGGFGVTAADISRGFKDASPVPPEDIFNTILPEPSPGFLGRPHGWER
jgi:hypothetical protein